MFYLLALLDDPAETSRFEAFLQAYQAVMIGVAFSVLQDYHDAEEAVLDALYGIARNFSGVKKLSPERQKAYACRAAQNRALSLLNRRKRSRNSEVLSDPALLGIGDREFVRLCEETDAEILAEALKELDGKYRAVLDLFYAENRSTREIAGELGLKRETVKTLLKRGREKLKKILIERGIKR